MISLERLVEVTKEEIGGAFERPVDSLIETLQPGIFLQSWINIIASVGGAFIEFWFDLQGSLSQVPARIVSRLLVDSADLGPTDKVVTVRAAKVYAVEILLGTIGDIAGRGPPGILGLVVRSSAVKGAKARFAAREEKQILGPILYKIFGAVRAPVRFLTQVVQAIWRLIVAVMGIGAVFCLYAMLRADFSEIALSQLHKRKRIKTTILRRL